MLIMQPSLFAQFLFFINITRKVYALPAGDAGQGGVGGTAAVCDRVAVRREWRDVNKRQRTKWVKAVQCLARKPHNSNLTKSSPSDNDIPAVNKTSSLFDDFAFLHADLSDQFHNTGLFLPFHRWMLHAFYTTLEEQCGYTGSVLYWDWTRDASKLQDSKIWDGFQYALGGLGDSAQSFTVTDGGFKSIQLSYPTSHYLKRQITQDGIKSLNVSFTKEKVEEALACANGNLECLQTKIEKIDSAVEAIVGGDFASDFSPNDPLFYLHRANVDRIWWLWQRKSMSNTNALARGQTLSGADITTTTKIPSGGLLEEWQVGDLTETQSGKLCYIYF